MRDRVFPCITLPSISDLLSSIKSVFKVKGIIAEKKSERLAMLAEIASSSATRLSVPAVRVSLYHTGYQQDGYSSSSVIIKRLTR